MPVSHDVIMKSLEFTRIPPEAEAWRKVLSLGIRLKFSKGATIRYGEHLADFLFFLDQGEVRLVRTSLDGREKFIWVMGPGSLLGETPFLDGLPTRGVQIARTDCVVYAFSRKSVFEKILPQDPELMTALLMTLASKVRVLSNQSVSLSLDSLASRICKYLQLRVSPDMQNENNVYVNPGLNQQDLANMLGVHRVTLNKALRELEKNGVLGPYCHDEVYILDMQQFRKHAFLEA